jgi:predicted deacylase
MPEILRINKHNIGLGETLQTAMNIARLPSRTKIDIPIYINRGREDGPVLLMVGGLHGDEINGIEIIRRMISRNILLPQKGTVMAIPILNIYGFLTLNRETPDGKDLNRSFPGSKIGSLASRIAFQVTKDILPIIDIGLDFHTGGASRTNIPQIRCDFDFPKNLEFAKAFAPQVIVNSELVDKSLRKAAQKMGKPILVYEGGESLRLDEHAIEEGIKGTQRLMAHLGMIEPDQDTQSKPSSIVLTHNSWIRAKAAGLFRSLVKNGQRVKKGQVMGAINDPFGEVEAIHKAPHNCVVFGVNMMPVVHEGEAIFHIGTE